MRKVLLASVAAVLMGGSLANAQFLLYSNDNDHKKVENVWAGQSEPAGRHAARMPGRGVATATTMAGRVSPGFLLYSDANGHKKVENQYAPPRNAGRYAAPIDRGVTMSTTTAGRIAPGFLLGEDENGHKRVINQYAR